MTKFEVWKRKKIKSENERKWQAESLNQLLEEDKESWISKH